MHERKGKKEKARPATTRTGLTPCRLVATLGGEDGAVLGGIQSVLIDKECGEQIFVIIARDDDIPAVRGIRGQGDNRCSPTMTRTSQPSVEVRLQRGGRSVTTSEDVGAVHLEVHHRIRAEAHAAGANRRDSLTASGTARIRIADQRVAWQTGDFFPWVARILAVHCGGCVHEADHGDGANGIPVAGHGLTVHQAVDQILIPVLGDNEQGVAIWAGCWQSRLDVDLQLAGGEELGDIRDVARDVHHGRGVWVTSCGAEVECFNTCGASENRHATVRAQRHHAGDEQGGEIGVEFKRIALGGWLDEFEFTAEVRRRVHLGSSRHGCRWRKPVNRIQIDPENLSVFCIPLIFIIRIAAGGDALTDRDLDCGWNERVIPFLIGGGFTEPAGALVGDDHVFPATGDLADFWDKVVIHIRGAETIIERFLAVGLDEGSSFLFTHDQRFKAGDGATNFTAGKLHPRKQLFRVFERHVGERAAIGHRATELLGIAVLVVQHDIVDALGVAVGQPVGPDSLGPFRHGHEDLVELVTAFPSHGDVQLTEDGSLGTILGKTGGNAPGAVRDFFQREGTWRAATSSELDFGPVHDTALTWKVHFQNGAGISVAHVGREFLLHGLKQPHHGIGDLDLIPDVITEDAALLDEMIRGLRHFGIGHGVSVEAVANWVRWNTHN